MGDSFQVQSEPPPDVRICALVPCHNNADTVRGVVRGLPAGTFAIVVDDGSDVPVPAQSPMCEVLRFPRNRGKAEALKAGFAEAAARGFTHAVALDADGQHPPELFGKFAEAARANPGAIIAGVRDFSGKSVPPARRFMNKFSNFWFRFETSVDLGDTQCGYRCYPLEKVSRLKISRGGFAYEAELLVRAAWAGIEIIPVEVPAIYTEESLRASHYRPIADTARFSAMNAGFAFMSLVLPRKFLRRLSVAE